MTLAQIADVLGNSGERVRQIQTKAIRKIKCRNYSLIECGTAAYLQLKIDKEKQFIKKQEQLMEEYKDVIARRDRVVQECKKLEEIAHSELYNKVEHTLLRDVLELHASPRLYNAIRRHCAFHAEETPWNLDTPIIWFNNYSKRKFQGSIRNLGKTSMDEFEDILKNYAIYLKY